MKDLIERLREKFWRGGGETNDSALLRRQSEREEAADAIEKLEAENAALKAELAHVRDQKPVATIRVWIQNNDRHATLVDWEFPGFDSIRVGEHLLYAAPGAKE